MGAALFFIPIHNSSLMKEKSTYVQQNL